MIAKPAAPNRAATIAETRRQLAELDWQNDLPQALSLLDRLRSADTPPPLEATTTGPEDIDPDLAQQISSPCLTPAELSARFIKLHDHLPARFEPVLWNSMLSAVDPAAAEAAPEAWCGAVMESLQQRHFLPLDVLRLIRDRLPFEAFFASEHWQQALQDWPQGNFFQALLMRGVPSIETALTLLRPLDVTTQQFDTLMVLVQQSGQALQQGEQQQAFDALINQVPHEHKPLLFWQRALKLMFHGCIPAGAEQGRAAFSQVAKMALHFFPQDGQLWFLRAGFDFHTQPPEVARATAIEALVQAPDYGRSLLWLGRALLASDKFEQAILVLQQLQSWEPLNLECDTWLAVCQARELEQRQQRLARSGSLEDACDLLQRLLDLNSFNRPLQIPAALAEEPDVQALQWALQAQHARVNQEQPDEALMLQALDTAKNPAVRLALWREYLHYGWTLQDLAERHKKLFECYLEFPDSFLINYHLGMQQQLKGNYSKAVDHLDKALAVESDYFDCLFRAAQCRFNLQEYDTALERLDSCRQLAYTHLPTLRLMALTYVRKGEHFAAYWYYQLLIETQAMSRTTLADMRGYLLAMVNALAELSMEQRHDPERTDILESVQGTMDLFDRWPKPDDFFQHREGQFCQLCTAEIYDLINRPAQALMLLGELDTAELHPDWLAKYRRLKGRGSLALGLYQEVVDLLLAPTTEALESAPDAQPTLNQSELLGDALLHLGDVEQAHQWQMHVLEARRRQFGKDTEAFADWAESFLGVYLDAARMAGNSELVIRAGNAYLEEVRTLGPFHLVVCCEMGKAHMALDNPERGEHYHRLCLEYAAYYPGEFEDFVEESRSLITESPKGALS